MEPVVWSTSKSTQWNHIKNTGYHDSIGKVFWAARKISWLQRKDLSKMMQKEFLDISTGQAKQNASWPHWNGHWHNPVGPTEPA